MRWSLRMTVPLLLVLSTVAIGVFALQHNTRLENREVEEAAVASLTGEMTRLQGTIEYLLRRGDIERVQEEVAALGADPDLAWAFLVDDRGTVLAATRVAALEKAAVDVLPPVAPADRAARSAATTRAMESLTGGVQITADGREAVGLYPVMLGAKGGELRPSRIGLLFVQRDISALKAHARRAVEHQVVQFSLFVVGVALFLWLLFHVVLTRRINRLIAAAGRLAAGDLTARSGLSGRDEVAAAGQAIDRMAEDLALSRARLQASEERFRRVVESNMIGIIFWDIQGHITEANDAFLKMVGYTRDDLVAGALRWKDVTPPEYAHLVERGLKEIAATGVCTPFEKEYLRKDGSRVPVVFGAALLEGFQDRGVGFVLDITERKRADHALRESEKQLRHSQKLEAVGRLAGGVAHDFNNLLTVIAGRSELMRDRLRPDDPLRRDVELIFNTAECAAALTRQLLAFSRRQVLAPKVLDLNAVTANVHTMLGRLIGEDIDLVIIPGPSLGRVEADPGQIEQIIMNLAINARDAMPNGGRLTIRTANVEVDEANAARHRVGSYVRLAVSDTGTGMDAAVQAHLFEPFFTTKELGKGTGLGLSTVYGIVEQSGGFIGVDSEAGRGTTVEVYLPRVEDTPETDHAPAVTGAALRGSETVLLAEDEATVRDLMDELLRQSGYTVLKARDAHQALLLGERHAGPIHLLVTDVIMPQMNGPELSRRIAVFRPAMKVLYVSGYTDNTVPYDEWNKDAFLQKPFTTGAFTRKVREILDEHGPSASQTS
ncbi:MAG: PAS domain S-box protein [Nitrospirae bacterium]|nr:PAS domain S-box protein [Nitrospirota bacterium]